MNKNFDLFGLDISNLIPYEFPFDIIGLCILNNNNKFHFFFCKSVKDKYSWYTKIHYVLINEDEFQTCVLNESNWCFKCKKPLFSIYKS